MSNIIWDEKSFEWCDNMGKINIKERRSGKIKECYFLRSMQEIFNLFLKEK